MNYEQANEKLQGRNKDRRKLENNTWLVRRGPGKIAVQLHETDVVTLLENGDTVLNSGGYRTITTKDRINRYASVNLYQNRGQWFFQHNRQDPVLFDDGLTIHSDYSITGGRPVEELKVALKLRRRVQKYAKKYVEALRSGQVEAPGAGDCFYCQLRTEGGKTLGEVSKGSDHLLLHVEEDYFVPSLVQRSLEVMPSSIAMKSAVGSVWSGAPDYFANTDFVWTQIQKNLARYILRQLGQAS